MCKWYAKGIKPFKYLPVSMERYNLMGGSRFATCCTEFDSLIAYLPFDLVRVFDWRPSAVCRIATVSQGKSLLTAEATLFRRKAAYTGNYTDTSFHWEE